MLEQGARVDIIYHIDTRLIMTMPPLCNFFTIVALLLCCPPLPAQEQGDVAQLWQGYAELGMFDKLLTELETESRKGDSAREAELIRTLLTYWEPIMNRRHLCNVICHWDGDGVFGSISYRTQDMPPEMVQQYHALRIKAKELSEEEQNQLIAHILSEKAYIAGAPDAEKIDRIIRHIHAEEYPQAIKQLAQLRQEHPDYCPQAFAELAAALDTPKRLELLLLCTRLPLGVIRETHFVK